MPTLSYEDKTFSSTAPARPLRTTAGDDEPDDDEPDDDEEPDSNVDEVTGQFGEVESAWWLSPANGQRTVQLSPEELQNHLARKQARDERRATRARRKAGEARGKPLRLNKTMVLNLKNLKGAAAGAYGVGDPTQFLNANQIKDVHIAEREDVREKYTGCKY